MKRLDPIAKATPTVWPNEFDGVFSGRCGLRCGRSGPDTGPRPWADPVTRLAWPEVAQPTLGDRRPASAVHCVWIGSAGGHLHQASSCLARVRRACSDAIGRSRHAARKRLQRTPARRSRRPENVVVEPFRGNGGGVRLARSPSRTSAPRGRRDDPWQRGPAPLWSDHSAPAEVRRATHDAQVGDVLSDTLTPRRHRGSERQCRRGAACVRDSLPPAGSARTASAVARPAVGRRTVRRTCFNGCDASTSRSRIADSGLIGIAATQRDHDGRSSDASPWRPGGSDQLLKRPASVQSTARLAGRMRDDRRPDVDDFTGPANDGRRRGARSGWPGACGPRLGPSSDFQPVVGAGRDIDPLDPRRGRRPRQGRSTAGAARRQRPGRSAGPRPASPPASSRCLVVANQPGRRSPSRATTAVRHVDDRLAADGAGSPLGPSRCAGAILRPTSRPRARGFFCPAERALRAMRRHGLRRTNRRDPRLRGVQAAQLPDEQVAAQHARPDRDAQVLPLVRPAHAAQGDPLAPGSEWRRRGHSARPSAASARRSRAPAPGRRPSARDEARAQHDTQVPESRATSPRPRPSSRRGADTEDYGEQRRARRRRARPSRSPGAGVPAPQPDGRPSPPRRAAPTSTPRTPPRSPPRAARAPRAREAREGGAPQRTRQRAEGARPSQAEKRARRRHRLPRLLLGRAEAGPVARPRHAGPGLRGDPHLRRRHGRLPRRRSTRSSTGSSSASSSPIDQRGLDDECFAGT